jgi:two-component system, NarL family, nitrate/nitrite response regulator NarL
VRVLVVADVRFYSEGLVLVLGRDADVEVTGAVAGRDALDAVKRDRPDVVLLDVATAGARMLPRMLSDTGAHPQVVALAVRNEAGDVLAWAEAGVASYVTIDGTIDELISTIKSVNRGELDCSPSMASSLLHRIGALSAAGQHQQARRLTGRENEIVDLLAAGMSNKQIARQLYIELPTVKNHVHNIFEKLNVSHRQEAADWAREKRRYVT